jgi:3-hydroxyacyl-CoA dehydrogenase
LDKLIVRKAAVLGAGVMGAQIAAHLANANVPVLLFDLPAKEGDRNGIVNKALDGLKKLEPAPLAPGTGSSSSMPPTTTSTCRCWPAATW